MSNKDHNISLSVMPSQSPDYQFAGGNGRKPGDVESGMGQGVVHIFVQLVNPPSGYRIRDMNENPPGVQFAGTGVGQLSADLQNDGRAKITNKCEAGVYVDVDYTINVSGPGGTNIACHPKIVNT